ncbi:MAG: polysulfide reductase NrfD, partial [Burkholderiaceae bacterium]|nr:polysulfide reductase NrfD [Burkholderiaceae bacterium]
SPNNDERRFYLLAAIGAAVTAAGLWAAHLMETEGHIITGMNNHIVWGMPHVFAIFLIVAASGVLNVASIGSVFGETLYKARAPLSGLLCIAMLAGGLMVLMLDLGRPERIIVAATHYNVTSVFAWNVLLYSGMFALVAVYLWTLLERRFSRFSRPVGVAVFVWRLILTTGTGSIFGFLVARDAYASALLAPMFVVMSFGWGLAVFYLVQAAVYAWNGRELPGEAQRRINRLLGIFVAASLYLVAAHHLTGLYFARQSAYEAFVLRDGGIYTLLFWGGFVLLGSAVPLTLIFARGLGRPRHTLIASALVIAGAFAELYAFIIGGQAWPLVLFPGATVSSSFMDGAVVPYAPSAAELMLGLGGVGVAFLVSVLGIRVLDLVPYDPPAPGASADTAPQPPRPAPPAAGAPEQATQGS